MIVGEKIKKKRKELGLTLKQLSSKIDISISFLSDIENNRSKPSLDRLKEIAEGLECSVSYLLGEEVLEEKKRYLLQENKNILLHEEIEKLFYNESFVRILNEFKGFDRWTVQEKEEVLSFLKAKREFKNN
ncbi:MAG: helix-turn-helix domain-containing protein [Clostridia bacterium]|nr:helix-turn-helix domain-containing protein [Clostridia bacterium]